MMVNPDLLNAAVEALERRCVQGTGSGGTIQQSQGGDMNLPEISIYGPKSREDDAIALQLHCLKGASKACEELMSQSRRKQNTSGGNSTGSISGGGPWLSGTGKQTCSGSCMNPNDCDANSGCLCGWNKGAHFFKSFVCPVCCCESLGLVLRLLTPLSYVQEPFTIHMLTFRPTSRNPTRRVLGPIHLLPSDRSYSSAHNRSNESYKNLPRTLSIQRK